MQEVIYKEKKETRAGFGEGLLEVGKQNNQVVALCADLTGSVKMDSFAKAFPERFFQVGIAEANMVGMAAGMALAGKIPFVGSFANFCTSRVLDQVRMAVAYSNTNVKICGSHAGITLGEDGATHQVMEDLSMMKNLPNMVVINPCDFNQTKAATIAIAQYNGPVYLRYGRPKVPNFTPENHEFKIGKALIMNEGKDVSIFATGHMVYPALQAAYILEQKNIGAEVIDIHTIKPLDTERILKSVRKTRCVVTAEEHLINGGLGDSIAQLLVRNFPCPQEYVAVDDRFGESGTPDQLLKEFHLTENDIVDAVLKVMARK
ncbi:MAG: transketolase family protein [Bacteroidales bacterium]|jgi:transketolase|nr:transketolase family protein [Bacteroidales bacterium]MBQ4478986.1 transketolase family protein [Bacteroidales bacterium]MBR4452675.1 transketolase family protein [Bacteroidales bacterium]